MCIFRYIRGEPVERKVRAKLAQLSGMTEAEFFHPDGVARCYVSTSLGWRQRFRRFGTASSSLSPA